MNLSVAASVRTRAAALSKLAGHLDATNPAAARLIREAGAKVGEGAKVATGPLAVALRAAGLDAVIAATACRLAGS